MGDIGKGLGEALMFFGLVAVFGVTAMLCGLGFLAVSFFLPISGLTAALGMAAAGFVSAGLAKLMLFAD